MSKQSRLFLVAGILLVSGCTVPGTDIDIPFIPSIWPGADVETFENDVIIIKSIQSIPSEIAPAQRTKILVHVENRIDKEVDSVTVELYDHCPGSLKLAEGDNPHIIGKLLGREIREVSWTLEAEPDIKLVNTCPKDGVKVRVKYPFTTISSTTISFINEVELQRRLEAGSFRNIPSNIKLGEGPVKPILTIEDAQPVSTGSGSTVIALQLENKGSERSGFVKDSKIPTSNINFVSNGFPTIAAELKTCIEGLESKELKLIQRKSPKIPCRISIPEDAKQKIESSDTIFAFLGEPDEQNGYEYEFRKSVIVTVRPKL